MISTKLQVLAAIKAAQYEAIIAKGGTLSPGDWSAYAAAIAALPSGGGAYNPDFPSPIFNFYPSTLFVNGDEPTSKAWYVRPGGAGDKDGRDWDNAFADREDAIEAAESGDHIRVMEGLYYIGTIQIPKYGVSEYYGFTQADGNWATRNPWLHPSKLDACFTSNRWQNDTVVFPLGQVVDGLYVQNVFGGSGIVSLQAGKFRNVSSVNCSVYGMHFVACTVDNFFVTQCINYGVNATGSDNALNNGVVTNCSSSGVYNYSGVSKNLYVSNCSLGVTYLTGTHEDCIAINCSGGTRSSAFGEVGYGGVAKNCIAINCGGNKNMPAFGGVQSMTTINCIAINCSRGFNVTNTRNCSAINCSSYGFSLQGQAINNVCYGCEIYAPTSGSAYKIYNCASNVALSGVTGWDTNADVQDFLTLTDFPFAAPALPPWDAKGAFNYNLSKGEESLAYIKNTVIPSMLDAHLPAGSPLIGTGYYEAGVTPDTDADGKERPLPPSIGAYEYVEEA